MFTLWILEPDEVVLSLILSTLKKTIPDRVQVRSFKRLSSLWKNAVSEGLPDLILGEWMPGSDKGTDFMISVRRLGSVDLIPITSDSRQLAFSRAIQAGSVDYLLKPFSEERLTQSILRYYMLRNQFSSGQPLLQKDIDRFLFSVPSMQRMPAEENPLPSRIKKKRNPLLQLLAKNPGGLPVTMICQTLSISRTAALDLLSELEKEKLVCKSSVHTGLKGRPRNLYYTRQFDRKEKT